MACLAHLRQLVQVCIRNISHEEQQNALKEVAILRKLRHPNIIAYKDSYVEAGNLAIIMEFAQVSSRHGTCCEPQPHSTAHSSVMTEPRLWVIGWRHA